MTILNKKNILIVGSLAVAYYAFTQFAGASSESGTGSLGGSDEPEQNLTAAQGFGKDPNSVPTQPDTFVPLYDTPGFVPSPDAATPVPQGTVYAGSPSSIINNHSGSNNTITPGEILGDVAVVGGAVGGNYALPKISKVVGDIADSKLPAKAVDTLQESNFQKWLKDPYNVAENAESKLFREGTTAEFKAGEKVALKEAGILGSEAAEKVGVQSVSTFWKGVKGVANFIPFMDIPIGAGLDVYFTRNLKDGQAISVWDALKANTAGELAQLGFAGAGAAAGTVVPVVGNIAGGTGGWIAGTALDISATEAYYSGMGYTESSLFGSAFTKTGQDIASKKIVAGESLLSQNKAARQSIIDSGTKKNSGSKVSYYDMVSQPMITAASAAKTPTPVNNDPYAMFNFTSGSYQSVVPKSTSAKSSGSVYAGKSSGSGISTTSKTSTSSSSSSGSKTTSVATKPKTQYTSSSGVITKSNVSSFKF